MRNKSQPTSFSPKSIFCACAIPSFVSPFGVAGVCPHFQQHFDLQHSSFPAVAASCSGQLASFLSACRHCPPEPPHFTLPQSHHQRSWKSELISFRCVLSAYQSSLRCGRTHHLSKVESRKHAVAGSYKTYACTSKNSSINLTIIACVTIGQQSVPLQ